MHSLPRESRNYIPYYLAAAIIAKKLGLEVHAGHGLNYNTTRTISKIKEISELNNKVGKLQMFFDDSQDILSQEREKMKKETHQEMQLKNEEVEEAKTAADKAKREV